MCSAGAAGVGAGYPSLDHAATIRPDSGVGIICSRATHPFYRLVCSLAWTECATGGCVGVSSRWRRATGG